LHADLIFRNGVIRTFDPAQPIAEALVCQDGKIIYVGRDRTASGYRGPATRVIDLAGRALYPGFIDAHQHQLYMGLSFQQVDVGPQNVSSISEIVALIQIRASKTPAGDWIEGRGFHDARLIERRNPTRYDLDLATRDHPVLITRACGHIMTANSRALALAGISQDTPDPAGGMIERDPDTGEPTGILRETAMSLIRRVIPRTRQQDLKKAILEGAARNLRYGITSVWEPSIEPDHLRAYLELEATGDLPLRVTMAQKMVLRSGEEPPLPRPFARDCLSLVAIKLFQDGGFGGATAALTEPYTNSQNSYGQLIWGQEELKERVRRIDKAGLRISIHAIGDRAIRSGLQAIKQVFLGKDRSWQRPRLEHCGLPLPPLPVQIANCGIVVVAQPVFLWFDGDVYMDRVGPERARWLYPLRTLIDNNVPVAGSSDGPVVPDINPLLGAYVAATRLCQNNQAVAPEESLDIEDAIALFTSQAAYACGEEQIKGSLTAGKVADLVIFAEDPLAVELECLLHIPVEGVFVGGWEVENCEE
jgi:predicted amidohydrolase YtcJ